MFVRLYRRLPRARTVLFTSGWMITNADEQAIRLLPTSARQAAVDQDGTVQEDEHVAEITLDNDTPGARLLAGQKRGPQPGRNWDSSWPGLEVPHMWDRHTPRSRPRSMATPRLHALRGLYGDLTRTSNRQGLCCGSEQSPEHQTLASLLRVGSSDLMA
jgi:hypothetical protein